MKYLVNLLCILFIVVLTNAQSVPTTYQVTHYCYQENGKWNDWEETSFVATYNAEKALFTFNNGFQDKIIIISNKDVVNKVNNFNQCYKSLDCVAVDAHGTSLTVQINRFDNGEMQMIIKKGNLIYAYSMIILEFE